MFHFFSDFLFWLAYHGRLKQQYTICWVANVRVQYEWIRAYIRLRQLTVKDQTTTMHMTDWLYKSVSVSECCCFVYAVYVKFFAFLGYLESFALAQIDSICSNTIRYPLPLVYNVLCSLSCNNRCIHRWDVFESSQFLRFSLRSFYSDSRSFDSANLIENYYYDVARA